MTVNRGQGIPKAVEHGLVVLDVIRRRGPIQVSDLLDAYEESVEDPLSERTIQKYLSIMRDHGVTREWVSEGITGTSSTYDVDSLDEKAIVEGLWPKPSGAPKHVKPREEEQ